jgi:hypothetical protein
MRSKKRILAIVAIGGCVVAFEILGFHLLDREMSKFAQGLGKTFESLAKVVDAAARLSDDGKRFVAPRDIPQDIWGKWVVRREIPTTTISCWSEGEAKKILGTEIEYSKEVFRWKEVATNHPLAEIRVISDEQFHDDNSGQGSNSSQITFSQLGIQPKQVMQVLIHHTAAKITGATVEIPGDEVLVKDKETIIFSACNVYFEAKRIPQKPSPD